MRKLFLALILAAAATEAAQAQDQCYTPEVITEKGGRVDLKLVYDLQGAELAAFNATYERATGQQAPDVDRLLVFSNQDPEGQMVWLAAFKDGCIIAKPVPMSLDVFNQLHGGRPI